MSLSVADLALELREVIVAFDALRAVDRVSLTVPVGQRRAIIGPNGAGKTTLFNAISGVVIPTAGRVTFNGRDMTRMPPHRRARLGISRTFQITNLFPSLSVEDNMVLALRGGSRRKFSLFGTSTRSVPEDAKLGEALAAARLHAHAGTRVRELSYGEQRQLELALAIVVSPRLVLLDEPAAGLSPAERRIVADVIRALPRTLTIVLIEHDMDLALGLADHVTCLHEGRVLIEADPDAIRRDARVQEVYLGRPHHA
ncbi:MAG: ABC transporter ATP-binding protein [Xanthobacteraceae bacterium]|nr:ABC transporter ATP-binding protein [Xanthobacteraceae bacterium]